MANNRNEIIYALPKEIFTPGMKQAKFPENEVTAVLDTLSRTGRHFHGMFKKEITESAQQKLYHAIIGDDRKMVKRILMARPDLLSAEPPKHFVLESPLTWQRFHITETPMVLAAKLKQMKMLELLDELDQAEVVEKTKAEAIAAWKAYQLQKKAQGEDEIVVPREYAAITNELIDVFRKETFPKGNNQYGHGMLSAVTEAALATLFHKLLPEKAVKLDDYLDVELLLLALYRAYWNHFDTFNDWDQRTAFCIRTIGLVQSVLTPETAEVFCESLEDVVTEMKQGKKKEISKEAARHELKDGKPFYRSSRDSLEGTGFNFLIGIYGASRRYARGCGLVRGRVLDFLCRTKATDLQNLCRRSQIRNFSAV